MGIFKFLYPLGGANGANVYTKGGQVHFFWRQGGGARIFFGAKIEKIEFFNFGGNEK